MPAHPIRAAIHGLGNIGREAIKCIETAPDMDCIGLVRGSKSLGTKKNDLRGLPDFDSFDTLTRARGAPDVVLVCGPSRSATADAARYLEAGAHTVDSFDIHDRIREHIESLNRKAVAAGRCAIVSAGWDPGSDSVLRALFEAMAPVGTTFTNFGRGRSMGHSVAARSAPGVADAASITIPMGGGKHSRLVFVLPEAGADREEIKKYIAGDFYFEHDPLEIRFVETPREMASVMDTSHGVLLERTGASGLVSNQRFSFDMRIDNPALTAQVMVSAARAAARTPPCLAPGCWTLVDVPPVALLPGDRMANIARLV